MMNLSRITAPVNKAVKFIISLYGHPTWARFAVFVMLCSIPAISIMGLELPYSHRVIIASICTALAPIVLIFCLHGPKPRHWVEVGHEIELEQIELGEWLRNKEWIVRNVKGRYKYTGHSIIFANASDAVAYKLRWVRF